MDRPLFSNIGHLVEHLGRGPAAQGLMRSLAVVEPEAGAQFPPGFTGVDRLNGTAEEFIQDVAGRVDQSRRIQISSDGFSSYHGAIKRSFKKGMVDYAQVVKQYENGKYVGSIKRRMQGNSDYSQISTSLMERHNLTTRMSLRRYNRKTNAHSKKIEHHYLSLALYFTWYNFCRMHSTIKMTPAMKAGLSTHQHDFE